MSALKRQSSFSYTIPSNWNTKTGMTGKNDFRKLA